MVGYNENDNQHPYSHEVGCPIEMDSQGKDMEYGKK